MAISTTTFRGAGLKKRQISRIDARAREMHMSRAEYVEHLLETDLKIAKLAREKTFQEILGEGRAVDEGELDALVEKIKKNRQASSKTKK